MELFREDGCLSDEGLHALTAGQLDELGRLEAAEHLSYCDKCTDRYTALLTADALDLLAMKLRTPLQVQLHLTLALEAGYQTGEKPITAALVESVLSRQLDDLEPTLTRHGYRLKDMVEQFDAKPAEIRAMFNHQLDPARTAELRDRMLAVGLPI